MHAAEGPRRVDRAVSSPLSIISLGDVGGDGGVTDRATRERSLFSRIRDSQAHYLTGPETTHDSIPSPSRVCVGSNHSGMGKPINFHFVPHLGPRGVAG